MGEVAMIRPEYGDDFSQYIPDFRGSELCAATLKRILPVQSCGQPHLFLTPDNSLDKLRIELDKQEVPYIMASGGLKRGILFGAADGHKRVEIALHDLEQLARKGPFSTVVTGVAAVTSDGVRLGKGHGFFDIEWALLSQLKLVSTNTEVVAI